MHYTSRIFCFIVLGVHIVFTFIDDGHEDTDYEDMEPFVEADSTDSSGEVPNCTVKIKFAVTLKRA